MITIWFSVWVLGAGIAVVWLALWVASRRWRPRPSPGWDDAYVPFVTVQVPVYNDGIAVECVRLLRALDYPKDRYEIVIGDDSTDREVVAALRALVTEVAPTVRHFHRSDRTGFKPGNLQAALALSRGEIIVVFDADWRPRPSFLRAVIPHFRNEKVAIVQTREDHYNATENLVTRFAAAISWMHYRIVMRTFDLAAATFFCGTAGALRRSALEAVGGWNAATITEDAELSVRLLREGWQSVYVEHDTEAEVPATLLAFLRQQARWCFGNARVALDNPGLFFDERLPLRKRALVALWLFAHVGSVVTVLSVIVSIAMLFVGPSGFQFPLWGYAPIVVWVGLCGGTTLWERGRLRELPWLLVSSFVIGIPMAFACAWQFVRAIANRPTGWVRTPKRGLAEANAIVALEAERAEP